MNKLEIFCHLTSLNRLINIKLVNESRSNLYNFNPVDLFSNCDEKGFNHEVINCDLIVVKESEFDHLNFNLFSHLSQYSKSSTVSMDPIYNDKILMIEIKGLGIDEKTELYIDHIRDTFYMSCVRSLRDIFIIVMKD